jgi:hypothetical protein
MGCYIAILLYADDAAVPADTSEDLQLAASIVEEFFNKSQLFIAVPKTFVTVFHSTEDAGVVYADGGVEVDGVRVVIQIYGQEVAAASRFKYLGVHFNEFGSNTNHIEERTCAFERAANMLRASLRRIPSYSFDFMVFLWNTLVQPVMSYGAEVHGWTDADSQRARSEQSKAWRALLHLGGRSPAVAAQTLLGLDSFMITWRVRRAGLFLRLLNSPAGSWTQIALVTLRDLNTAWYTQTVEDVRLVIPTLDLQKGCREEGFYLSCASCRQESSTGKRHTLHAHPQGLSPSQRLQTNRAPQQATDFTCEKNAIKKNNKRLTNELKAILRRQVNTEALNVMRQRAKDSPYTKTSLLWKRELANGPALPTAMQWIGPRCNREAVATLISGDWCLGVHAGNFFGKAFIPNSRNHITDAASLEIEPSRVCLACWHKRRQLCLDDEGHVLFECPEHLVTREAFMKDLSAHTSAAIAADGTGLAKTVTILSSSTPEDWKNFGRFAGQLRQARRRTRKHFEVMQTRLDKEGFEQQRLKWRQNGRFVCRHGVLFAAPLLNACPCMDKNVDINKAWQHARKMASIDHDLKNVIAVPFELNRFRRLGQLRGDLKRLNYV